MRRGYICLTLTLILLCLSAQTFAQEKLLTVDDIYDPARRVNFSGSPPVDLQWLKDGQSYLQSKTDRATGQSQILKVNAVTGEAKPYFDAARMEAALAKLPGMSADDAKQLAH